MNKTIEILNVRPVHGPNRWTNRPVLEAIVDIHDLEDFPSDRIEGLPQRLEAWLPGLIEHRCSVGERGGFLQRLHDGTWAGHILEHISLEILGMAGVPAGFGRAREMSRRGVYHVVIGSAPAPVAERALELARGLLMAAIEDRSFDVDAVVAELEALAARHCLGPDATAIVDAARQRGIPATRLNEGDLVQLGYGANQRRIWMTETDRTSAIAESISSDEELSTELLEACGVPLPERAVVRSAQEAWEEAEWMGLPVVIRPLDSRREGVACPPLDSRAAVEAAWKTAAAQGEAALVERCVRGREYRLLVVDQKVVAAARLEPAVVVGDGRHTVLELLAAQAGQGTPFGQASAPSSSEAPGATIRQQLAGQGLEPESVPVQGREILLQQRKRLAVDVTDDVHPEVARIAALAARVIDLDIAGVDLIASDIRRPLAEQGGAIVDVQAAPDLLLHLQPTSGKPRPVGEAIVDSLFARGNDGRIPIIGVSGSTDTCRIARLVAWLQQLQGRRTGLACSDGLFLAERRIPHTAPASHDAGRLLLMNPTIECAVMTHDNTAHFLDGLPYDHCQIGLVTDLRVEPQLAQFDVTRADQVWRILRTQVDVVLASGTAVLNADDPEVLKMTELCAGEVILYSRNPDSSAIASHCDEGGQAVHLRAGSLVLAGNGHEITLLGPAMLTQCSRRGIPATTVLAVAACAVAQGIAPEVLRTGFDTFEAGRTSKQAHDRGMTPHLSVAASAH